MYGPCKQESEEKNLKISIFNMQNRTLKKIACAKKNKKILRLMYLERSVLMSRFQNCKPKWKLLNIDRVIDKKIQFFGQLP